MTRFWGGSPTLTDAQAAELFAERLPVIEMPKALRRRIWRRVRVELWRMRLLRWIGVVS